ncbi:MAG: hypothetical protein A3E37_01010 [Candidatus Andersenbacteria bacterium RIFCSPHIGHO2_12_FULL_46_9]|nr:MAG: hypothetical protein UW94_C0020G0003 [Parcubacteria group bacterium GW2011_GWA2_45_14]OGY35939.1 MAG: hypothetical protein A3B76_04155 [Candidatus Andersenbacteria bacterium RIFCSPHIGHO2_02_FULL_46_16]OGY37691.1 MAG: hypothetical protein A3E37_01010 [Candidatus Andersenbacteria bacterium RIFCSPHIGHO2_12_FULL_46_9]OGY38281.1 MAG: hypothetical protein A3I08_03345 [Candidatus Andersenbacteria bacterium RIFCSPLOWO2_02_FULL_46_11]
MTQFSKKQPQKQFRFEVDQSGRVEELRRPTIIAIANNECAYALLMPAKMKRTLYEIYRTYGKPKRFGVEIFSKALIYTISQSSLNMHELIIDLEYPGYNEFISQSVSRHFRKIYISFASIGKSSPAHKKAYFTYKTRLVPNSVINKSNIRHILAIKDGRRTVTPRVYTDSQSNRPVKRKHNRRK